LSGCLCLAQPPVLDWGLFEGRRDVTTWMSAGSADLLLHFAEVFRQLNLPVGLVGDVLPVAVRAVLDDARLGRQDDWFGVARKASSFSKRTIEDYVAQLAAQGGGLIGAASR
jgi:hypothetical protein